MKCLEVSLIDIKSDTKIHIDIKIVPKFYKENIFKSPIIIIIDGRKFLGQHQNLGKWQNDLFSMIFLQCLTWSQ